MSCGRKANTPVFREPSLSSSTGNRIPRNSRPPYLQTHPNPWLVVDGEPLECLWLKSSARSAWFCFMFSMLFTGSQVRRYMKPPSLSQFAFSRISIASFARWSTYPDILSNMEVRLEINSTTCLDVIFLTSPNFRVDPHCEHVVFFVPLLDKSSSLSSTHFATLRYTPGVRSSLDFLMSSALATPCFACVLVAPIADLTRGCRVLCYQSFASFDHKGRRESVYSTMISVVLICELGCETDKVRSIKSHSPLRGDLRNVISSLQHISCPFFVVQSYHPRPSEPVHP